MKHSDSNNFENISKVPREGNGTSSGASRRDFLKSLAAVGTGVVLPMNGLTMQVNSAAGDDKSGRIDIHHHITPPALVKAVGTDKLLEFGKWTPEKSLEAMDAA